MHTSRLILAIVAFTLCGCVAYRPRDVIVCVRDAETHAPVAGASVHVSMPHTSDEGKGATTLPNGMARVAFTPSTGEPVMIEATATGYLSDSVVAREDAVSAVATYPVVGPALPHKPDFTLELYAGPTFSTEFVVPAGYHGLIRADLDFRDDIPIPKGQRLFVFDVSPKGEVQGTGPAVLKKVAPGEYRVRMTDALTPVDEDPDGLALRWLKREDGKELFHFGTRAEFGQYRKDTGVDPSPTSPPESDKKGGRGGRRRGGGRGGPGGS